MSDQELNSEKDGLNEKESSPETLNGSGKILVQYKPEYCEEIIKHGEAGGTFQDFANKIGRKRHALSYWAKVHPEFREAMDISFRKREKYFGMGSDESNKDKGPKPEKVRSCDLTGLKVKSNYELIFEEEISPTEGGDGSEAKKTRHILHEKYRSEYCEIMIRLAEEGKGLKYFCAKVRTWPKSVQKWAQTIPEFQEAVILSKMILETYWMDIARRHMVYRFDFKLWKYIMETAGGYKSIISDEEPDEKVVQNVIILPDLVDDEEWENDVQQPDLESAEDPEKGPQIRV